MVHKYVFFEMVFIKSRKLSSVHDMTKKCTYLMEINKHEAKQSFENSKELTLIFMQAKTTSRSLVYTQRNRITKPRKILVMGRSHGLRVKINIRL
jgi:hypothetical protein